MIAKLRLPLIVVFAPLLAACASGGGGDVVVISDNGLPVASAGQNLNDAEGAVVTAQAASVQAGGTQGIDSGTIQLNSGFFSDAESGTISVFGESVDIVNGVGVLSTGEEVVLIYDEDRSGTYAGALEFAIADPTGISGEVAYVFGFQTDTADLPTGTVDYQGGFLVSGFQSGDPNAPAEYQGTIDVTVDFGGDQADVTLDGLLDGNTVLDLSATNLGVNGGGFAGGLGCDNGCANSSSEVDATFYGPNAEELGGVLSIDTNVYNGAGTFIIDVE